MAMRVLLVDDDLHALEVQRELIEHAGHLVITAASRERALDLIGAHEFDAAFIDVVLGGADGFDVLRCFTQAHPAARAYVLTAHDKPENLLRARRLGARAFLTKPLRWDELRRALDAAGDVTSGPSHARGAAAESPDKRGQL
ncbi:MAG: response regulator [Acidobacteriota bacterium]